MLEGFTRQEAALLCEVPPSRLSYLDQRTNLVSPQKIGNPKRPICIYSWQQLLIIKAISLLREETSLQTVRNIIKFLEQKQEDSRFLTFDIMAFGDRVCWCEADEVSKAIKHIAKQFADTGRIIHVEMIRIASLNSLATEISLAAQKNPKIDYPGFLKRVPDLAYYGFSWTDWFPDDSELIG